jgi:hypothetical protein
LSLAETVHDTAPETVELAAGAVMDIVGAVMSVIANAALVCKIVRLDSINAAIRGASNLTYYHKPKYCKSPRQ